MSIPFSKYSIPANVGFANVLPWPALPVSLDNLGGGVTQVNSAQAITLGLGVQANNAVATIQAHNNNFVVNMAPNYNVAQLEAALADLADRWWIREPEAARRLIINAVVNHVLHQGGGAFNRLGVYVEKTIPRQGGVNQITVAAVGNGPLDFLIGSYAAPAVAPSDNVGLAVGVAAVQAAIGAGVSPPIYGDCLVIEAKQSLAGVNINNDAWQLFAQLARVRQLRSDGQRYFRGVLTDGILWRFYQFDCTRRVLLRSATIDIVNALPLAGFNIQNAPIGGASALDLVVYGLAKFFTMANQANQSGWL